MPADSTENHGARIEKSLDAITVWRIQLDRSCAGARLRLDALAGDERERASRFHFDRDRWRFVTARVALRFILSPYLDIEPARIVFTHGPQGKPSVAGTVASLRFNVSHSHDAAVIAVAHGREVGVDIEFIRALSDMEQLMSMNFSPREIAAFHSLPIADRQTAFFAGWTRKEAYLKARGGGLSIPLDSFAVSLTPGEPAALLEVDDDEQAPTNWRMADLSTDPGYAGAVVAEGHDWHLAYRDWTL